MNWILLILAGCLELVFTFCLGKINRVFEMEKYVWSFVLLVSLCVSMLLLIKVTKTLPVGTAMSWSPLSEAAYSHIRIPRVRMTTHIFPFRIPCLSFPGRK